MANWLLDVPISDGYNGGIGYIDNGDGTASPYEDGTWYGDNEEKLGIPYTGNSTCPSLCLLLSFKEFSDEQWEATGDGWYAVRGITEEEYNAYANGDKTINIADENGDIIGSLPFISGDWYEFGSASDTETAMNFGWYPSGWGMDEPTFSLPDKQLYFTNLPKTFGATTTVQVILNKTNCTADKSDTTEVESGSPFEVHFTADTGNVFETAPYADTNGDITNGYIDESDNTKAGVSLNAVSQLTNIYATAVGGDVEPSTGLGFVNIYNPTFEQYQKACTSFFMNIPTGQTPTLSQFVVSIHRLFCDVSTQPETELIKFGNYTTDVHSKVVNQLVTHVSCGKVTVPELYHSALDYQGHTQVKVWLPFIGFYDLDPNLIVNREIEIRYSIDVAEGNGLCELVDVLTETVIYRFVGQCKFKEPWTLNQGTNISKEYLNGAYNMAEKVPYFLVERPIDHTPQFSELNPYRKREEIIVGQQSGYLKCLEVHVEGINATQSELEQIELLLKQGVLVD